jgi:hypothetical protein
LLTRPLNVSFESAMILVVQNGILDPLIAQGSPFFVNNSILSGQYRFESYRKIKRICDVTIYVILWPLYFSSHEDFFERKLRIPIKCLIHKQILRWSSQGHKVTIGIEIGAPFLCTHQMKGEFSRSPNGYFFSTCIISDASTILST